MELTPKIKPNTKPDELESMGKALKEAIPTSDKKIVKEHTGKEQTDGSGRSRRKIDTIVKVIKIKQGPLSLLTNRLIKRFVDVFISVFVLILILSWLIPLLGIIDLFSGKNGIFFIQQRPGLNNKPFSFNTDERDPLGNILPVTTSLLGSTLPTT